MRLMLLLITITLTLSSYAFKQKVLILHSYHPQFTWTHKLNNGLVDELTKSIPKEQIFIEYMDARRFFDEKGYKEQYRTHLAFKFKNREEINLILSTDDYALGFLQEYKNDIFGNAPVIFGGVNAHEDELKLNRNQYTGILEGMAIADNIELIKKLHPNYKQISLIVDKSSFGLSMIHQEKIQIKNTNYRIMDNHTASELKDFLKNLPSNDIPLMLAVHKHRDGSYFSYERDLPILVKESSNPLYGMWGMINGYGVTGGIMNDPYNHGTEMASYAKRYFEGESIAALPVVKRTKYFPQFDHIFLEKYKIDRSLLPKDSVIINVPESFYHKHRTVILFFSSLLSISLLLIFILNYILNKRTSQLNLARLKLNELLGVVAHDLRNPIGFILSMSDLLTQEPDSSKEGLEMIKKSATKSVNLVNDILTISALELGKVELNLKRVNLNEVIDHTINELSFLSKQKNVSINTNLNEQYFVKADQARLQQILQNLITNAIKFTNENGEVRINVTSNGENLNISVNDNGVGIPLDAIQDLFDMGRSKSTSGTQGEQGTGYGLPLVFSLVKKHGSTLKVKSEVNKGTTFYFNLKRA